MTDAGEALTRGTVWLALSLYVGSEFAMRISRLPAARRLNAFGCAAFLAHVACAFQFYHHWSHSAAYADTARQTAALTGWNSGAGLYVNYVFAIVWIATVVKRPSGRVLWTMRGFFWFMIFNGTVVFAHGPTRWFGILLCAALIGCWRPIRRRVPK